MDRAASFATVARILREAGHRVLTYDRAGYASAVDERPFTDVHDAAADLVRRIESERDRDPVVAVGHSFGGHLAILAAIVRPDLVRAVGVYEAPVSWLPSWPPDTSGGVAIAAHARGGAAAASEAFLRSLVGDDTWESLPERTRALRVAEGDALAADLLSIRNAAPYDPADLTVPVVAGRGSAGAAHHRLGADWLCANAGSAADLHVVDGAGHGAHRSHPGAFAALVQRVVDAASASPTATP